MGEPVHLEFKAVCFAAEGQISTMKGLPTLHIPTLQNFDDVDGRDLVLSQRLPNVVTIVSVSNLTQFDSQLEIHEFFHNILYQFALVLK